MSRAIFVAVMVALSTGCGGKVIFDTGAAGTGSGGAGGATHGHTTGTLATTGTGVETGPSSVTSTGSVVQTGPSSVTSTGSGTSTVISCGMNACDGTTQECCASPNGAVCLPKGMLCKGLTLDCSSAANCAVPNVCCAKQSPMTSSFTATCEPKCGGGGPASGIQLCATSAECLNGAQCMMGPEGIKFCFMPGGGGGGAPGGG